ncbi:TPA: hypothetical protein N0F65_007046 [Lagenidium giganteum]|uniref:Uncharacterized protein n=1 Tax=Lagenidium giganteum TaxID=4803 RepID=A0AAV2YZI1_9STRA|nr:TPA: hypothetical protein N0F65_007046 [Lagenidium giganteum]
MPLSKLTLLARLASYVLLCSDVLRSGLGTRDYRSFKSVEPDVFQVQGPWAYPVNQVWFNDTDSIVDEWTYKLDSTSIVWRAFAKYLQLDAFPPCVMYESECVGRALSSEQVFKMMNQIPSKLQSHYGAAATERPHDPIQLVLRSRGLFFDRLHHLVLPQVFFVPWQRTLQALYYSPERLKQQGFDICSYRGARPMACADFWANYRITCHVGLSDTESCATGRIWNNIYQRYRHFQVQFPSMQVDLTLLASTGDITHDIGGIARTGSRDFDVTTIIRVRDCGQHVDSNRSSSSVSSCETVLVDDYRYEGWVYASIVTDWYAIVSLLRATAQAYLWLRLLFLAFGCYVARASEPAYKDKPRCVVFKAAMSTMARMPSQGVIYGSVFPVLCYVTAHLIDAAMTYDLVSDSFSTVVTEAQNFNFIDIVTIAAIQMRNVWILALGAQLLTRLRTWRLWSPSLGISGLPKHSLSAASCLTMAAQYRSDSQRNTNVLDVHPVPPGQETVPILRAATSSAGVGEYDVYGVMIDIKALVVVLPVLLIIHLLLSGVHQILWKLPRRHTIFASSPVPFSAGVLWPSVAMIVRWQPKCLPLNNKATLQNKKWHWRRRCSQVQPLPDAAQTEHDHPCLQTAMNNVCSRSEQTHAAVAFINLYAMTDPLTLFWLRFGPPCTITIMHNRLTGSICALPATTLASASWHGLDLSDMEVVRTIDVTSLTWSELLHCG